MAIRRSSAVAAGAVTVMSVLALSLVAPVPAAAGPVQALAACVPAQLIGNPGFETGTAPWTASSGVIGAFSGQSAHGGTRFAWLDGYGSAHTDTLSQTGRPAGRLHDRDADLLAAHRHRRDDGHHRLRQADRASSAPPPSPRYSNVNTATGYQQRTVDVSAFAGQTVTLTFTGVEDASAADQLRPRRRDARRLRRHAPARTRWSPTRGPDRAPSVRAVSLQIQATDPQGDALTYSATGLPAGLTINASYRPDPRHPDHRRHHVQRHRHRPRSRQRTPAPRRSPGRSTRPAARPDPDPGERRLHAQPDQRTPPAPPGPGTRRITFTNASPQPAARGVPAAVGQLPRHLPGEPADPDQQRHRRHAGRAGGRLHRREDHPAGAAGPGPAGTRRLRPVASPCRTAATGSAATARTTSSATPSRCSRSATGPAGT